MGVTGDAGTESWSSRANSNSWGDGKDRTRGETTEVVVTGWAWGVCWFGSGVAAAAATAD